MICDASLSKTHVYLRIRNYFAYSTHNFLFDLSLSDSQVPYGYFGNSEKINISPVPRTQPLEPFIGI